MDESRGVVAMLAETNRNKHTNTHENTVACHDLAILMCHGDGGRRKALAENDLRCYLIKLIPTEEDNEEIEPLNVSNLCLQMFTCLQY